LHRAGEIAFVRRRGKSLGFSTFTVFHAPGREPTFRVAVTITKAVGIAVVRNRLRRRIQGALDRSALRPAAVRVVFVVKPAGGARWAELACEVEGALRRLVRPG